MSEQPSPTSQEPRTPGPDLPPAEPRAKRTYTRRTSGTASPFVPADPELAAIGQVVAAIGDLEPATRTRVLMYVMHRFEVPGDLRWSAHPTAEGALCTASSTSVSLPSTPVAPTPPVTQPDDCKIEFTNEFTRRMNEALARTYIAPSGKLAVGQDLDRSVARALVNAGLAGWTSPPGKNGLGNEITLTADGGRRAALLLHREYAPSTLPVSTTTASEERDAWGELDEAIEPAVRSAAVLAELPTTPPAAPPTEPPAEPPAPPVVNPFATALRPPAGSR